jgi:hypothetical protein
VKDAGGQLRRTTVALVFPVCVLIAAPARTQAPASEPVQTSATRPVARPFGEVPWVELQYSASKFLLSARTTIRAERVPAESVGAALRTPPKGTPVPIPMAGGVALSVTTDLPFGRDETVRMFIDPACGAALGGEKTMLGGSAYHKLIRFTDRGLFTWRTSPDNSREASQPPESWTHAKQYLVEPPAGPTPGTPISDPYALIYLATAARLDRKDSRLTLVMLADDRFVEITFIAGNLTYRRVGFEEAWPGGKRARRGDALVRTVRAAAKPLGAAGAGEDVELGFLGMRGALTIYLEVGTALPVALAGRIHYIGEVTVQLDHAVLAAPPAADPAP